MVGFRVGSRVFCFKRFGQSGFVKGLARPLVR